MSRPGLDALVEQLDRLFQSALDRMETQARDAHVLEQALKRILCDASPTSVLGWDVEKAITPIAAYRALALRIIDRLPAELGLAHALQRHQYIDLLDWPDAPKRTGDLLKDYEAQIRYARRVSLRGLIDQVLARFAPDTNPSLSATCAAVDLLRAFAIPLQQSLVVPVQDEKHAIVFPMLIQRTEDEERWVLPQRTAQRMARAHYAIGTLATLDGTPVVAQRMAEMTRDLQAFVTQYFGVYEPDKTFRGGAEVAMRMRADWIDYEVSERIAGILRRAMAEADHRLAFVPAATLFSEF